MMPGWLVAWQAWSSKHDYLSTMDLLLCPLHHLAHFHLYGSNPTLAQLYQQDTEPCHSSTMNRNNKCNLRKSPVLFVLFTMDLLLCPLHHLPHFHLYGSNEPSIVPIRYTQNLVALQQQLQFTERSCLVCLLWQWIYCFVLFITFHLYGSYASYPQSYQQGTEPCRSSTISPIL